MTNTNENNSHQFSFMANPVGAACNLSCEYCYYLEKRQILPNIGKMSTEVLRAYIEQSLTANSKESVCEFNWSGGEPLLAGKDFFRRAIALEGQLGKGRQIRNTLQTNGLLLDDEWCDMFKNCGFFIGVSIDGPANIHNAYRKGPLGEDSFAAAMRAIELLRKHKIPYKTLTTINSLNENNPIEVYEFLSSISDYLQFSPVLERHCTIWEIEEGGLSFAEPPTEDTVNFNRRILPFSATPEGYGNFLIAVFDIWRNKDIGKKFVQLFEVSLCNLLGRPSALCVHSPSCGNALSVEPNGDVYPCDRYAYPACKLGNILQTPLLELAEQNRALGLAKHRSLNPECLNCEQLRLCYGGCPKDRVTIINAGETPQNYFCPSYKKFFAHLRQFIKTEQQTKQQN